MSHKHANWLRGLVALVVLAAVFGAPAGAGFASQGAALPADMRLEASFSLPQHGLTYERYQQYFGEARVLGGQITLYRDAGGQVAASIGRRYADIAPLNSVNFGPTRAQGIASRDIGPDGERSVDLAIDPHSGRYFYWVETRRADSRWMHWIDAGDGALLNKFDALMTDCGPMQAPCGFGVAYDDGDSSDVKNLQGLTTWNGSTYLLLSADARQETHDALSKRRASTGDPASDADDSWVLPGNETPAQPALVDAQYYTNVTDDYYLAVHGYDWIAAAAANGVTAMVVYAHYSVDYNNASWNGHYVVIGDGDQVSMRELTSLDVVGHEFSHGVTDFTSDLIYSYESGALNESFSDIMGTSMEFFAEANGLEPASSLEPDWWIAEDLTLEADEVPGFRNMADPNEDGDPSHYLDRYTGTSDNGGVHTNSGIPNHWFYLLSEGGQNANPLRASGTDVIGIGLAQAEAIAFLGFTALPEDAGYCDARDGTIAVAGAYAANVADAWDEVGVDEALCGGGSGGSEVMYVAAIDMSGLRAGQNRYARAVVTILDTSGSPVSGATVSGVWSGDYSASVSGETGSDGTVTFTSGARKLANATFTFTVDDVAKTGMTYDPSLNLETSDTVVVP